jgi:hypothetical protein
MPEVASKSNPAGNALSAFLQAYFKYVAIVVSSFLYESYIGSIVFLR